MDRRQKKTRQAIFEAFGQLLKAKHYNDITVQEIIDTANIGRSTFYAHFETKDALLQSLCAELFTHIVGGAVDHGMRCSYRPGVMPDSVFLHILLHLLENDLNILTLLSCGSNELFLGYFKQSMTELARLLVLSASTKKPLALPEDFLVQHIAGSFVDMVQWWLKTGRKQTPEQLDCWFRAAISPLLQ